MPVYKGIESTKRAIFTAWENIQGIDNVKLLLIDDFSPEIGMREMLESAVAQLGSGVSLLRNAENLGFVKTANIGFAWDSTSDIVLLNNDVLLPKNWLNQLIIDAYSDQKIGTVTPLSNNTTISSFPNFNKDNFTPFGMSLEAINAVFQSNQLEPVVAPTGIGFCFYIKRACLDEVSHFDEVTFGKGYGEDCDFCQRAQQKGWKNVLTPNLYVTHLGSVSFGDSREQRVGVGTQNLLRKHPNYATDVQRFNASDPLKFHRLVRLCELAKASRLPIILHVSHGVGGGVEQHVEELNRWLYGLAVNLILTPLENKRLLKLAFEASDRSSSIVVMAEAASETIFPMLRNLGISFVHYHHTLNISSELHLLLNGLSCPKVLTVHDYHLLNRSSFVSKDEPERALNLVENRKFVEDCSVVLFPSDSCRNIFCESFQIKHGITVSHPEFHEFAPVVEKFKKKNQYLVGIIGAINEEKGAVIIKEMTSATAFPNSIFKFVIVGYSTTPLPDVTVTGPFHLDQVDELLSEVKCDLLFFPGIVAETYSYSLSIALRSGLPIIARNIGSFPERLSNRKLTLLFGAELDSKQIYVALEKFVIALEEGEIVCAPNVNFDSQGPDFYKSKYVAMFGPPKANPSHFHAIITKALIKEVQIAATLNETVLRILWEAHSNPALAKVFSLLPMNFKRWLKRRLTSKPIHEVIRKLKQ
jgi:GT2 family glycosyltransferase/glycosyltransferase involved in cell wall biosynthesis